MSEQTFDSLGLVGSALHYSLILTFMGIAVAALAYFWIQGGLSLDEEPKEQMMEENDG